MHIFTCTSELKGSFRNIHRHRQIFRTRDTTRGYARQPEVRSGRRSVQRFVFAFEKNGKYLFKILKSRGFLKHFVIKTNGVRKRRFDRSTVIIKQSEDKNFHKY